MGRIVRHRPEPQNARASAAALLASRRLVRLALLNPEHDLIGAGSESGGCVRAPAAGSNFSRRLGQNAVRRPTISSAGRHRSGGAAPSLGMDRRVSCPWTTALALGTVDEPWADPRLFPLTPPKFAPPLPAGRLTLTELQWPLRRVPAPAPTDGPP